MSSGQRNDGSLNLQMDYFGGDFVEDGSFLVLSTDGLSLSPGTPPENRDASGPEGGEDNDTDNIEVLNAPEAEDDTETPSSSLYKSITQSQVLGEDPESSVESKSSGEGHSSTKGKNSLPGASQSQNHSKEMETPASLKSTTAMSSMVSVSSGSTDTHLIETNEEVNALMAENKKLAELLADSNEKMKQCIVTTEKLKADHEDYKKKNEESREVISRLRQDNQELLCQVSMIRSQTEEGDVERRGQMADVEKQLSGTEEELRKSSQLISKLNDRLESITRINVELHGKVEDSDAVKEELQSRLDGLRAEKEELLRKLDVMKAEIDRGREVNAKLKVRQERDEAELKAARVKIQSLEALVEEKSKLTENLRRNMEDTVTALERCNQKLNEKEEQISLLTTQVAAINAESDCMERLQVLEVQCQTFETDFKKMEEERAKLVAEKEALLTELNAVTQQLRGGDLGAEENVEGAAGAEFRARNDNSAANANESLPSPLTSLPSVAGQFVGFVRRELLGWEDQPGAASGDANQGTLGGAESEAVVQQPKQEAIPPCPICRKTFSSLERLQRHASTCGIEYMGNPDDPFVFP